MLDRKLSQQRIPTGWRRAALVNIGLLTIPLLLLVGLLAASISATGDVRQSWKFYTAECSRTTAADVFLHLLINGLSTAILASSNFFMQVLNAPTRNDINVAHSKGQWFDIGISSLHNIFRLSCFKQLAWLYLLLTSIPIHILFNSSIFEIDSRMDDFHITIATPSFLNGGPYSLPGAGLMTDILPFSSEWNQSKLWNIPNIYRDPSPLSDQLTFAALLDGNNSALAVNISQTAIYASTWERLDPAACHAIYSNGTCSGLREYRNVVVVADSPGWKRSDIWEMSTLDDELWEPIVPRDGENTLWHSQQCTMRGLVSAGLPECTTTCGNPFAQFKGNYTWLVGFSKHDRTMANWATQ
ncbi:hypothetical protein CSOJ01_07208 [Colletotrichum sojae]|uniref:DUF6536 domain-containing protein n=1 Tax=Colletotrichum sojae TaxID=2175907 RepID=A0A8H6MUM5_9PEZI|nr:hypothetical protein CSOJ01_07208 [Colletotrichum sojae]